jgi:hypothetical protein
MRTATISSPASGLSRTTSSVTKTAERVQMALEGLYYRSGKHPTHRADPERGRRADRGRRPVGHRLGLHGLPAEAGRPAPRDLSQQRHVGLHRAVQVRPLQRAPRPPRDLGRRASRGSRRCTGRSSKEARPARPPEISPASPRSWRAGTWDLESLLAGKTLGEVLADSFQAVARKEVLPVDAVDAVRRGVPERPREHVQLQLLERGPAGFLQGVLLPAALRLRLRLLGAEAARLPSSGPSGARP